MNLPAESMPDGFQEMGYLEFKLRSLKHIHYSTPPEMIFIYTS